MVATASSPVLGGGNSGGGSGGGGGGGSGGGSGGRDGIQTRASPCSLTITPPSFPFSCLPLPLPHPSPPSLQVSVCWWPWQCTRPTTRLASCRPSRSRGLCPGASALTFCPCWGPSWWWCCWWWTTGHGCTSSPLVVLLRMGVSSSSSFGHVSCLVDIGMFSQCAHTSPCPYSR